MEESERRRQQQQSGATEESQRGTPRAPKHIARTPQGGQPKEEPTKTYRVKDGQTWGNNPVLQAGDTVELTEAEAAGFEDKLEPVDGTGGDYSQTPVPPPQQPPAPPSLSVPKRSNQN